MDSKTDIIGRVLRLSETTDEGLQHIYKQTMNGHFSKTMDLFTDIVSSFHEIERALMPILLDYDNLEIEEKSQKVVDSLRIMLLAYEGTKDVRPMEVLQFSLLPGFSSWQAALYDLLGERYNSTLN